MRTSKENALDFYCETKLQKSLQRLKLTSQDLISFDPSSLPKSYLLKMQALLKNEISLFLNGISLKLQRQYSPHEIEKYSPLMRFYSQLTSSLLTPIAPDPPFPPVQECLALARVLIDYADSFKAAYNREIASVSDMHMLKDELSQFYAFFTDNMDKWRI